MLWNSRSRLLSQPDILWDRKFLLPRTMPGVWHSIPHGSTNCRALPSTNGTVSIADVGSISSTIYWAQCHANTAPISGAIKCANAAPKRYSKCIAVRVSVGLPYECTFDYSNCTPLCSTNASTHGYTHTISFG
mmetsp:Transcript_28072/g.73621  ORF Transcript_28072/g.73621 Transcript_28072/m.73621 type:complete len:133 (+) Transcript_28072:192-590(+)